MDCSKEAINLSQSQEFAEECKRRQLNGISVKIMATPEETASSVKIKLNNYLPDLIAVDGIGIGSAGFSPQEAFKKVACIMNSQTYTGKEIQSAGKRLEGCIAIVTGGAQGFGKGIAEEMLAEGAAIVIADMNENIGVATVDEINEKFGAGSAIFVRTDVTKKDSIQACVEKTVRTFGGIDILISNAGVLKAGGIEDMDESSFDFVTNVNYKAYFLCVQAVVHLMKLQRKCCGEHFMDIIQINSKSGLEGSNKNFAYAGSKFGGIGLTQSFALELVEYGIKVNAICPGNYYEGPLWSDPEKGLFVQYLRAGKVPGAKTIEDVKAFYVNKVPMKRGCSPRDVAKAIFYLHEQNYETGQALPVTGGQVMLN